MRTARSRSSGLNFFGILRFSLLRLGTETRTLQQRLIDHGWSKLKKDGADGRFGTTMEKVVRQFQKAVGLKVDGQIGPDT